MSRRDEIATVEAMGLAVLPLPGAHDRVECQRCERTWDWYKYGGAPLHPDAIAELREHAASHEAA